MRNELAETCVRAWECFTLKCVYFGPQRKCVISSACLTNRAKRKNSWMLTIAFLCCC